MGCCVCVLFIMLLAVLLSMVTASCCAAAGGRRTPHGSSRPAPRPPCSFGEIAKQGTTMLLPASANDPASMVASALSIYKQVSGGSGSTGGSGGDGGGSKQAVAPQAREAAPSLPRPAAPSAREAAPEAYEQPPPPPRVAAKPRFTLQHMLE